MILKNVQLNKEYQSSYGNIRYDVVGTGPPLVLVHGTPWSSFNWRHLLPALSNWFTVYYYDLLGYGQSEKKEGQNVSLGIQNEILKELLQEWQLDNPYIVGHDFGGTTVLRAHLLNNVNFKKIILVDPVAIEPWGSPFFSHVNQFEEAFKYVPSDIHTAIVSAYIKSAQYNEMSKETREGIISFWQGEEGQSAFYRQIAQASQKYTDEIEPLFKHVSSETLIVWGQEDKWIPVEKSYILHEKINNSHLKIIPNAGHLVQEDTPTILFEAILSFIRK